MAVAHDPVVNPSIHYLGVEGATTQWGDHSRCVAQWERIKAERSDEYGALGAYNFGLCNSHGIRMEGRGWDQSSAANGGENGVWYNDGSRAMCVLVGTDDEITVQCKQGVADFAAEAFARGMQRPLRGHHEFVATSCPGTPLILAIGEFNAGVPPEKPVDWAAIVAYLEVLELKLNVIKAGKPGPNNTLVDDTAHPEVFVQCGLDKSHVSGGVLQTLANEGQLNAPPPGRSTVTVVGVKVGLYLPDYLDTFRTV